MMLVVIGHYCQFYYVSGSFQKLFLFIYSFHMPAFFYISGLFSKEKKDLRNALLYLTYGLTTKLFINIYWSLLHQPVSWKIYIEGGLPWFMYALAAFSVIGYVFRRLDLKIVLSVSIVLACIVGYFHWNTDFLVSSRIIVYLPFYLLGMMTSKDLWTRIHQKASYRSIGTVMIVVWLAMCFAFYDKIKILLPLFTGRNSYYDALGIYGGPARALCYLLTSVIIIAFILAVPGSTLPLCTLYGRRTLQVYFWHFVLLKPLSVYHINSFLCEGSRIGKCIWLLTGIISVFLFSTKPFKVPLYYIKQAFENRKQKVHGSYVEQKEKNSL